MKKIITIITIMIMILSVGVLNAYAAYDCDVVLTLAKEKYEPGDTIEITVSAQNINAGDGITGISTVIEPDSNAFENMELIKTDNWDAPSTTGTTVSTNVTSLEGQTTNQDMFKIKLTVKSDIADGEYDVTLKSIVFATDDYTAIEKEDKTVKIKIEKASQNDKPEETETKPTLSVTKGDNAYRIIAHDDVGLERIEITLVETEEVIKVNAEGKDIEYLFPIKENDDNFIKVVAINTQNEKSKELSLKWSTKKDNSNDENEQEKAKDEENNNQKQTDNSIPANNSQKTQNSKEDTTTSNKVLSNAGLTAGICGFIILSMGLAGFCYIKYKKYREIK